MSAVGYAQVWLASVGLAQFCFPSIGFTCHPEAVAHIIKGGPVVSSYILHERRSFRAA